MIAPIRVYVDMVGDLFHAGYVAFLRSTRGLGDQLVVGVLSDETAAAYKRQPIMTLEERVAVIEACRYVDEVIADPPNQLTLGSSKNIDWRSSFTAMTWTPPRLQTCMELPWTPGCYASCSGPAAFPQLT